MSNYTDLEISILSCFLQKPKLMEETILEDKYFIKHKKIWKFMKAFYQRFKNFDLTLMMNISTNKYRMMEYIVWLVEQEPTTALFKTYEQELIREYKLGVKNKYLRDEIFELANDLYVGNIKVSEFNEKLANLYKKAKEMFK